MVIDLLALIFLISSKSLWPEQVLQPPNSVRIYGSCYNAGTGADIKIRAFLKSKKGKLKLGESNHRGRFDFQIPNTANYLLFESVGFQSVMLPVHFIGTIGKEYRFNIVVPMSAKGSARINSGNQLYMGVADSDSIEITYELKYGTSLSYVTTFNSKQLKRNGIVNFLLRDVRPGDYLLTGSTADGALVFTEKMVVVPGANFKALPSKKVEAMKLVSNVDIAKPFDVKNLYFDQSSYVLRHDTKLMLDSVSRFLLNRRDVLLRVTGYTDKVGVRNLNLILSEYRAKTVADYLKTKGIQEDQLVILWKGSDKPIASNAPEEANIKNRRVEIQLVPK